MPVHYYFDHRDNQPAAKFVAEEGNTMTASIEMPRYQCHKIVHALKLTDIERDNDTGVVKVTPEDRDYAPFYPVDEWYARFKGSDEDTGYFVVYEDGYQSWSPSKAFEEGYTRL